MQRQWKELQGDIPKPYKLQDRGHVRAVHVNLPTVLVDGGANLLKDGRIGHHRAEISGFKSDCPISSLRSIYVSLVAPARSVQSAQNVATCCHYVSMFSFPIPHVLNVVLEEGPRGGVSDHQARQPVLSCSQ